MAEGNLIKLKKEINISNFYAEKGSLGIIMQYGIGWVKVYFGSTRKYFILFKNEFEVF